MPTPLRRTVIVVVCLELVVILALLFHLGGGVWRFSALFGTIVGGSLTLGSIFRRDHAPQTTEPWINRERLAWILIGCGQFAWAIGECFWRYYLSQNQTSFPSLADAGYTMFPVLCFLGLLCLPTSTDKRNRSLVALDSLVSMGALLAISWYLLLGKMAQSGDQAGLAKFLGLYYPTTDTALMSCVVFLLMRGQNRLYQTTARKVSLLVIGLGLCFFVTSDFLFNFQQSLQSYTDGTWVDLGWPLGMLTIGLATYLRCFLPITSGERIEQRVRQRARSFGMGLVQLIPYALIAVLFTVLTFNVLSADKIQMAIRPVLVFATFAVIGIVVLRQILTIRENEQLSLLQARAIKQIEEQAQQIAERNTELEEGISHLKAIQTSLANGNVRARAQIKSGVLWSLATNLNLLAERLVSLGETKRHLERVNVALLDLSSAVERYRAGQTFIFPPSCQNLPEIVPLLHSIGLHKVPQPAQHIVTQLPPEQSGPNGMYQTKTAAKEIKPGQSYR